MLTIRPLRETDILTTPHWDIPNQRPVPSTTLVAVDSEGKIHGLAWTVYGGPIGLIVIWFSAAPHATIPLYMGVLKLARSLGCNMLLSHVQSDSRLLRVLGRRGWAVNSWNSTAVGRLVVGNKEAQNER